MQDDSWIDGEPAALRRRPALIAALALPWVLVSALILLRGPTTPQVTDGGQTTSPTGVPAEEGSLSGSAAEDPASDAGDGPAAAPPPTTDVPSPAHDDALPSGTSDVPGLTLTELPGSWRVEPGLEEAGALAVLVARAALTGVEPTLDTGVGGAAAGYAEHLVLEAVERSSPLSAVATVVAVVLEGEPLRASVRRLAVPISLADGVRPAGDPWELPAPDLRRHDPELQPWGGPDDLLEAHEALAHAGIDVEEVTALWSGDGWPVVAEVRLRGHDEPRRLWLRHHVDRLVAAGSTLAGAAENGGHGQDVDPRQEERR